jgi:quinoprotein glucose dehydrogenase
MSPRLLPALIFPALSVIAAAALEAGAADSATDQPAERESTFAGAEMAGQTMALAVDDSGRVYLSCTGRAFGRGVFSAAASDSRRREDLSIFSLDERRACTLKWIQESGLKLEPEQSERVVCLADTDRDGKADQRTVIAGDFRDVLDGPAGGITVSSGGAVFFGCTPALWRLEDDNADLHADRRLPLLTGFGIRAGSGLPGLRALTEGPDGRVYFTTTDRGTRVQTPEGPRFVIEDGGAVFRCRPDGSELELLATGLHDPAGIAVDMRGRVFVADAAPDGKGTRVLYVLPGADFGWDTMVPERSVFAAGKRPSWMLPEAGLMSGRATGLVLTPALADGARLPAFVMADGGSNGGLLTVSLVEKDGGFVASAGAPLRQGGAASGVAAGPDGSLFWADWGHEIAAASVSRIRRLAPAGHAAPWNEGAVLLAKGLRRLPPVEISAMLDHAHPMVRQRARQALTARGFQESLDVLTRTAKRSPSLHSRLNAVWGMGALAASEPMLLNEVLLLFTSAEPEIRALAVHVVGESHYAGPPGEILQLLRDPSPEVRVEAATAIARLRPAGCADALLTAIAGCGDSDPFLRHALTFALSRVLTPAELFARGSASAPPAVKSAVLTALRHLRATEIADFLDDPDAATVTAAAEAVYDGIILPGYPQLAAALGKCAALPSLVEPGFVRRSLAAALRNGTAADAEAVAGFLALPSGKVPDELRSAALQTLAAWDQPPSFEPVHGRFDLPMPRAWGIARPLLQRVQPESGAARPKSATFIATVENTELSDAERIDAIQQFAAVQPAKAAELCRSFLPGRGTAVLRAAMRTLIMKLNPPAASYAQVNEAIAFGSPQEVQAVLQVAARYDSKQSEALWLELGKKFIDGTVDPTARLEVLEGLTQRDVTTRGKFRRVLETAEAEIDEASDPLARWRLCETGGDPDKGRLLFETGRHLNCTACHSLRGRGGTDGPELDGVAARLDAAQLLASLVQPSAVLTPGYGHVVVVLQDGTRHAGLLRRRDDASLLLATRTGPLRLHADAVQSLSEPVSSMPSAAAILTLREIRDLVAWLATLK